MNRNAKYFRRQMRALSLRALPKFLAHRWIRNSIDLAVPQAHSQLRFEIVSNTSDLRRALCLVQTCFEREGYAQRSASGIRLTPYHLLPETIVIVAKSGDQIVATLSVIPNSPFGIPIQAVVPNSGFFHDKGKVVEISALAVNSAYQGQHGEVLFNLMKYMYHCIVDILRANTEVIGVNPKMVSLYEAILLFRQIPHTSLSVYDFANGAPVVPMYFSLDSSRQAFSSVYGGKPARLNLMDFFLLPPPPQFLLPKTAADLDQILPQRNPRSLREILSWDRDVINRLSLIDRRKLENLYALWPECAELIRNLGAFEVGGDIGARL